MIEHTKKCRDCLREQPLTNFRKSKDRLQSYCKECMKIRLNKSRQVRRDIEEYKNHKRNYDYLYRYGITLDTYNQMLKDQKGVCKICCNPCHKGKKLAVDHCRLTGDVRGLLCSKCNRGLGHFNDDPDLLEKALKYIQL